MVDQPLIEHRVVDQVEIGMLVSIKVVQLGDRQSLLDLPGN